MYAKKNQLCYSVADEVDNKPCGCRS